MSMNSSNFTLSAASANSQQPANQRRSYAALWEALCIAVDSIWTHKLRSMLTLLGIIIAIASVVTVGGAIEGLGAYVWKQLSSTFASNTFMVARIVRATSMEEFEKKIKRNKELHTEDMQAVEENCTGCEAISPMMRVSPELVRICLRYSLLTYPKGGL
jgi:putative ABC transport system permease protein